MSFMQPQITRRQNWSSVENGFMIPTDYVDDTMVVGETMEGFGARLSAPGYMDCTDWSVFETIQEAAQYLADTYYDMSDDEMTEDMQTELAELERLAAV